MSARSASDNPGKPPEELCSESPDAGFTSGDLGGSGAGIEAIGAGSGGTGGGTGDADGAGSAGAGGGTNAADGADFGASGRLGGA